MKKVLVVLAVVIGLTLVFTSGYAQKWDTALTAEAMAKGKNFKFTGLEILSIDPKAQTVSVKNPNTGKTAIARMGFAKYEGGYNGVADLKVGDKVSGEGQVVSGENWVTKIAMAKEGAKPAVGPNKSNN
jgi:hypothetical protein